MLAQNARPFTSSQSDSLIGSSPFRPTLVDSTLCGLRCILPSSTANMSKRRRYRIPSDPRFGTISPLCQSFSSSQIVYNSSRLPSIPKLVPNQRAATQPQGTLRNRCLRGKIERTCRRPGACASDYLHAGRIDGGVGMFRDPIVEEVRAIREAFAKQHGYDVVAIVRVLQREEAKSGRRVVSLPPKRLPRKQRERKAG